MTSYEKSFCDYLSEFLTPNRKATFNRVLDLRTRYISVVLEDIYQPHNASAVLRSCDCFGVQDVHVIENRNNFEISPDVVVGSSKWLNIDFHNRKAQNTTDTLTKLKGEGYRIIATTPHDDEVLLEDLDLQKGKIALVFGTEKNGISDQVREQADEFMKIPMYGFTESFNISVSAALCLHHLTYKLRQSDIDWPLTESEKQEILFEWVKNSTRRLDKYEQTFKKEIWRADSSKNK